MKTTRIILTSLALSTVLYSGQAQETVTNMWKIEQATTCGPCKMLIPMLNEWNEKLTGEMIEKIIEAYKK